MNGPIRTATLAIATAAAVAIACPATAAAGKKYDPKAISSCNKRVELAWANHKITDLAGAYRQCCEINGGVWTSEGPGSKCVAPSKEVNASDLPEQTLTPVIDVPPGSITQAP